MTDYSANVQAFVPNRDGNLANFSSFQLVYYIVHDGSRIGLTEDFDIGLKGDSIGTHSIQSF